jgi:hypothetical protein
VDGISERVVFLKILSGFLPSAMALEVLPQEEANQ